MWRYHHKVNSVAKIFGLDLFQSYSFWRSLNLLHSNCSTPVCGWLINFMNHLLTNSPAAWSYCSLNWFPKSFKRLWFNFISNLAFCCLYFKRSSSRPNSYKAQAVHLWILFKIRLHSSSCNRTFNVFPYQIICSARIAVFVVVFFRSS